MKSPGRARRSTVELTEDEALVLFEWLSRVDESGSALFEDQAEQRALWDLIAVLEPKADVLVHPEYDRFLAAARTRLRDAVEE